MTREQLQAWIERRYRGKIATAARALGIGRGPLARFLDGEDQVVPRNWELAALGVELGIPEYDGGTLHVALGNRSLTGA